MRLYTAHSGLIRPCLSRDREGSRIAQCSRRIAHDFSGSTSAASLDFVDPIVGVLFTSASIDFQYRLPYFSPMAIDRGLLLVSTTPFSKPVHRGGGYSPVCARCLYPKLSLCLLGSSAADTCCRHIPHAFTVRWRSLPTYLDSPARSHGSARRRLIHRAGPLFCCCVPISKSTGGLFGHRQTSRARGQLLNRSTRSRFGQILLSWCYGTYAGIMPAASHSAILTKSFPTLHLFLRAGNTLAPESWSASAALISVPSTAGPSGVLCRFFADHYG